MTALCASQNFVLNEEDRADADAVDEFLRWLVNFHGMYFPQETPAHDVRQLYVNERDRRISLTKHRQLFERGP